MAMRFPTILISSALLFRFLHGVMGMTLAGAVGEAAQGDVRCVRAGATGADTGLDWWNAHPRLPDSLVRGATYYVADGHYGDHVLDESASGGLTIAIRKATDSAHGPASGWQSGYGDGEAVFGHLVIRASDLVLDGLLLDGDAVQDSSFDSALNGGLLDMTETPPVNNCAVLNCTLRLGRRGLDAPYDALSHGISAMNGGGNLFSNVTVNGEGGASKFYSGTWMVALSGGPHTVTHCTLINGVDIDAFRVWGRFRIQDCVISNFSNPSYATEEHVDVFQSYGAGLSDGLFERNRVVDFRGQLGNFDHYTPGNYQFIIRNNVFANIQNSCFQGLPNFHWYNNVFYRVSDSIFQHPLRLMRGANSVNAWEYSGTVIRNNVFLECGANPASPNQGTLAVDSGGTFQASHNYYGGTAYAPKTSPPGSNSINGGDPRFEGLAQGLFRPMAGSPLIDAGTTIPGFAEDFEGCGRPQGQDWDIGAYEYQAPAE
jgi:hypothetical protein